jgi:hypothetical protein
LKHGHVVDEAVGREAAGIRELLWEVAEPPADLGALGRVRGVVAEDPHSPAVGAENGGEDAQLRLGAEQPRLHGVGRNSQQLSGLAGREPVEHGRLHDGPQVGGQPRQRSAEVAVLHAFEHLLLDARPRPAAHVLELHLCTGATAPQPRDEPACGDAPQPAGDLTLAAIRAGPTPDGDEGVLQHVGHHAVVVATPGQPDRQPRRMPLVELLERARVAVCNGLEQLAVRRLHASVHDHPVAARAANGSRLGRIMS